MRNFYHLQTRAATRQETRPGKEMYGLYFFFFFSKEKLVYNKLVSIGCFSRLPFVLFKPVQTFLNDTHKATYNLSVIFGSFQSIDSKKKKIQIK